jgi:Domain of unknown function (DUF834).
MGPTRQPHGPRWTGRTRLAAVGAVGPARQPHPRARVADGRAHLAAARARPRAASPARPTGAVRPRPDGHRRATTGAAERRPRERREGGNERSGLRLTPVDGDDGTAAEAEGKRRRGSGDEDDGAPAVGGRNGGADGVDDDAAKPKEAAPRGEEVRSDGGGEPELVGDGGERGRRRERDSDGESERRTAETEERGAGDA